MSNRKLFWLAVAVAIGVTALLAQVVPGYIDITQVPGAPANPSTTCLAGHPCNRLYVVGASGGTGSSGTVNCITTSGASCSYFGAGFFTSIFGLQNNTNLLQAMLMPSTANTNMVFDIYPSGSAGVSELTFNNSSDTTNTNVGRFMFSLVNSSANLLTGLAGSGTGVTTINIGESATAAVLSAINFKFNNVTKHSFTPTKFTTPAIEITGTTSAVAVGTDSSGNITPTPAATASSLGVAQCDGTTITCSGGVITAVSGGSPPGMVRLAQQVLSSPAATVTFAGIGGSFSGLQIAVTARASASATGEDMYMQFNGDTSADYSRQYIGASGGSAGAGQTTSTAQASIVFISAANALANAPVSAEIWIPAYAGTTFRKEAFSTAAGITGSGVSGIYNQNESVDWSSTAAITSITFGVVGGSNFVTGSTFTLYALQ